MHGPLNIKFYIECGLC